MKRLLLALLEFVAITAPATWWWMHGGQQAYFDVWMKVGGPILKLLGVTGFPPSSVQARFMNFLPFVAMMLITPGFDLSGRLTRMFKGLGLIFLGQVALAWWAYVIYVKDGPDVDSLAAFFPAVVMSDALPFVLWALFANRFLSEFLQTIIPAVPAPPAAPEIEDGAVIDADDRAEAGEGVGKPAPPHD